MIFLSQALANINENTTQADWDSMLLAKNLDFTIGDIRNILKGASEE